MKFKKTDVAGAVEILASNDFTAIPFTTTTAKKAGEVLTVDKSTGVVLYDVDPDENPNGSLVVAGVIDATKAKAHSGVDLTNLEDATLPATIILRTNTGVNA